MIFLEKSAYGIFTFFSDNQDIKHFFQNIDIISFVLCFMIYCFLGWFFLTVLSFIKERKFVNKGFLFLPVCPIYGFSMCLIELFLIPSKDNILVLFLASLFIICFIEYFTGYLLEVLFKIKLWDYSRKKFSIGGRICFNISILWAIIAVIVFRFVNPYMQTFVMHIPSETRLLLAMGLGVAVTVDTIVTILAIFNINEKLEKMHQMKRQICAQIESVTIYESAYEMINSFNLWYDDLIADIKERMNRIEFEHVVFTREEFVNRLEKIHQNYLNLRSSSNITYKRLFKAFPQFRSINFSDALDELNRYLKI